MKKLLALLTGLAALSITVYVQAADIGLVGLFPGKAVLVVDGSAPKTYSVGSTIAEGTRLLAVDDNTATIDASGKHQVLVIGQYVHRAAASAGNSVTLQADTRGHFTANGQINGVAASMLVDTGATMVAIPASDAIRFGINYRSGQRSYFNTANGVTAAYNVKLNSIKIGDVEMFQVDAVVMESGLNFILLGMSVLNRMDMQRNGQQMVLTKRY